MLGNSAGIEMNSPLSMPAKTGTEKTVILLSETNIGLIRVVPRNLVFRLLNRDERLFIL